MQPRLLVHLNSNHYGTHKKLKAQKAMPWQPPHTALITDLAGKEGECAASWLEEVEDFGDESVIAVLLQVGLEADKRALLLRSDVHSEVDVILGE